MKERIAEALWRVVHTRAIARLPILGGTVLILWRLRIPARYYLARWREVLIWLVRSNEDTNYTYDLEEVNRRYLGAAVAAVTGRPRAEIMAYFDELEADEDLRGHIGRATAT